MGELRVALCPLDVVVGDFDGNLTRILEVLERLEEQRCDLAVLPAGVIGGSPLGGLATDPGFRAAHDRALARLVGATGACTVVLGVHAGDGGPADRIVACRAGRTVEVHPLERVDPMGVADPGVTVTVAGARVLVTVGDGSVPAPAGSEVGLVVRCEATMFRPERAGKRHGELAARAAELGVPVAWVNRLGATDGFVFDGGAGLYDAAGGVLATAPRFEPVPVVADVVVADVAPSPDRRNEVPLPPAPSEPPTGGEAEIYSALVTGLGAYARATGFTEVTLGLSGGIDSALVATIAADTFGPDRVHAVAMPSRYSSTSSIRDAEELARNLGIELRQIPIEAAHRAFGQMLDPHDVVFDEGVTEQNLQARIRGVTLMALSNAFGWLVLACGNKSEAAVGYSTLYGDAVGGLSVIGDLYKTQVYALCRWRNRTGGPVVPEAILTKAPSAELRPGQRDDESLPPYEVLDPMLQDHVERGMDVEALIGAGHPADRVRRVVAMVRRAEYKRRQAPLPIVVSDHAFGGDRLVPVTNSFLG